MENLLITHLVLTIALATMMLVEFSHFEWKKGEHEGNLAYAL